MAKPLMFLPPVLFAALAGMFVWGMNREDPTQLPTALAGKPAPAVQLSSLEGAPLFTQADLADGQMKLVNFWASWCAPCRVEHPVLMRLAGMKDFQLLGLNYRDVPENARRYLGGLGNPFVAVGYDEKGRVGIDWGVYGQPETFVVSPKGVVTYKYIGPLSPEAVRAVLLPQIERAKGL